MKNSASRCLLVLITVVIIGIPHLKDSSPHQGLFTANAEQGIDKSHRIIVYYFHGDFRCPTCLNIEKMSRRAVTNGFKDYISRGIVSFKAINIDKKENEYYVNEFKAARALIIVDTVNGKKVRWKNLEKIWELAANEKDFIKYVQLGVSEYLNVK